MSPIVSFQNVSIVFGRKPEQALPLADAGKSRSEIREATGLTLGVADASLDVEAGEIAVLMGLSGSGKSTLLRAVNGLAPITRGRVVIDTGKGTVDPKECGSKRLRELRRHEVAMVFQQFALLPWRSVAENVGLGLELAGEPRARRRERVMTQLELVGLGDWAQSRVGELSGGMQQRVGLARAFATDAPILLMDEPFSALDPLIRARLQDELLEIQQRLKKTIIFVSHGLDEAFKIGNRIAIMEGGRIVQVGTAQDIVLRPADDYVADFVAHMNPLNVLTAENVMKPVDAENGATPARVAAMAEPDTPLKRVMESISGGNGAVIVSRNGRVVGQIGPQEIVDALMRH
ncbi:choline ABC transporter ATP-binding protein [Aurantimonas sp. C2-6-R+9]|uniref:choline ABC transporter ATP-binding protein n=1 Tax=unclassified Aurantimonas TaxID=2638230 RepID=UPI002E180916|nr:MULTISPECIES: choline ABC transporter ATP-binding protein [unclassified Aurantimonas]MEC5291996.1 choline ABC transporter ATP-binding protein [Aurantimonas sp. C2-3-R2]MEC5382148.1 choline ABC transporter ATP-binding protein [Aurantimonas sp. C2-6-R+9]MEC5413082.1 choline ABC transporter ATP-binding protein [Aurantimonas sp. C2-4-R8]